jgi:DNA-binding NarL/FixJ family response regulator
MDMIAIDNIADAMCNDSENVIRVMLIHGRQAMREDLRWMLSGESDIEVVGDAPDTYAAAEQVKDTTPDMIVMDIEVNGGDASDIARRLKRITSPLKKLGKKPNLIVLSDKHELLVPAIRAGVVAYLTKSVSRDDLIAAIRIAHLWRLILFPRAQSGFTLVKI